MPDLIGILRQWQPFNFALAGRIEQAQFDFFGMGGKQREIDALAVPSCAKRIGFAGPDTRAGGHGRFSQVQVETVDRESLAISLGHFARWNGGKRRRMGDPAWEKRPQPVLKKRTCTSRGAAL